jgi:regulator of protease activity HflC (stomatin/prohibitin superfamily)
MFEESARLVVWLVPIILLAVIFLPQMIRILREYERGVIFRLGKLLGTKGPGLIFLIPIVDRMVRMDLRVVTINVARQEVMTRDNVPMTVHAVVYFRVIDPAAAVVRVENYLKATSLISQTTLRSVLGQSELDELLSQRDKINLRLQLRFLQTMKEISSEHNTTTILPVPIDLFAPFIKRSESQTPKEP